MVPVGLRCEPALHGDAWAGGLCLWRKVVSHAKELAEALPEVVGADHRALRLQERSGWSRKHGSENTEVCPHIRG